MADEPRTRVFISYSRLDLAFAELLRSALIKRGYEAYLDKEDILPGEDWRSRLGGLILAADAVVFVLSRASLASKHCIWEVERTVALEKTLVPLWWGPVTAEELPSRLSAINAVQFRAFEQSGMTDQAAFETAMDHLGTALQIAQHLWVRDQTKWIARASEWETAQPSRPDGRLLRSADIVEIEAWIAARPAGTPNVSQLVLDYYHASRAKERADHDALLSRERSVASQRQRLVADACAAAQDESLYARAMRLALAAEPDQSERSRDIRPEPLLRAQLARAAFNAPLLGVLRNAGKHPVLNSDGRLLLTIAGTAMRVWDCDTLSLRVTIDAGVEVIAAQFDKDDAVLSWSGDSKSCVVWSSGTGDKIGELRQRPPAKQGRNEVRSRNGRFIAQVDEPKSQVIGSVARVVDAKSRKECAVARHDREIYCMCFSDDETQLLTTSRDAEASLWNVESGARVLRLREHFAPVGRGALSGDGGRAATETSDGTIRIWDIAKTHLFQVGPRPTEPRSRSSLEFMGYQSPELPQVTQPAHPADEVKSSMREARSAFPAARLALSPDHTRLVMFNDRARDSSAVVWDVCQRRMLAQLTTAWKRPYDGDGVSFSADNSRIAVVTKRGGVWDGYLIEVFESDSGTRTAAFPHDVWNYVVDVIPENTEVDVVPYGLYQATLYDRKTKAVLGEMPFEGGMGGPKPPAFSPDGRRIATFSTGNTIIVWDIESSLRLLSVRHDDEVTDVTFDDDGGRLLTASYDHTARVWDAWCGLELARFPHGRGVTSATFSAHPAFVETIDLEGAYVWDATWITAPRGDALVHAILARLGDEARLRQEEQQHLRATLGDVGVDIAARLGLQANPSADDFLTDWRRRQRRRAKSAHERRLAIPSAAANVQVDEISMTTTIRHGRTTIRWISLTVVTIVAVISCIYIMLQN